MSSRIEELAREIRCHWGDASEMTIVDALQHMARAFLAEARKSAVCCICTNDSCLCGGEKWVVHIADLESLFSEQGKRDGAGVFIHDPKAEGGYRTATQAEVEHMKEITRPKPPGGADE